MPQYFYLSHHGIKGQKWGIRRFRNYDDTLTALGKKRYGDGGAKMIKKAEKEKRRRDKILSDPAKLYRHRSEFTTAELEAAQKRFDTQARLREQAAKDRDAKRADIARRVFGGTYEERQARAKLKAETDAAKRKAKAQAEIEEQRLKSAKAEEQRKKQDQKRKAEKEERDEEKSKWPDRAKKLGGIIGVATSTKTILDELGITKKESGKSMFGSLGSALGLKDVKVDDVVKKSDQNDSKKNDGSKKINAESIKDTVTKTVDPEKTKEIFETKVDDVMNWFSNSAFDTRTKARENILDKLERGKEVTIDDMIDKRTSKSKDFNKGRAEYTIDTLNDIFDFGNVKVDDWFSDTKKKKKK